MSPAFKQNKVIKTFFSYMLAVILMITCGVHAVPMLATVAVMLITINFAKSKYIWRYCTIKIAATKMKYFYIKDLITSFIICFTGLLQMKTWFQKQWSKQKTY